MEVMMTNLVLISLMLVAALPAASSFASNKLVRTTRIHQTSRRPQSPLFAESLPKEGSDFHLEGNDKTSSISTLSRRDSIGRTFAAIATCTVLTTTSNPTVTNADIEGVVTIPQSTEPPVAQSSNVDGKSVTLFKTKSGLQYIELEEGTGPSPKYGNFVTIAYKAYIKLPDAMEKTFDLDEFDSDRAYLIKHGNGRTVPGLDEGLHTMKVGGKRRIIVPPKLGYVTSGLGPIPVGPYGRWKLNRLIDRMIELRGGNVIFDVEMKSILEDEADQGYYDDQSLSPDDFNTLRKNIEAKQQAARGAQQS